MWKAGDSFREQLLRKIIPVIADIKTVPIKSFDFIFSLLAGINQNYA